MTFFVRKALANGRIRFGVAPRRLAATIDQDPHLSTGKSGEFIRRAARVPFFADNRADVSDPQLTPDAGIGGTPFLKSVFDRTPRGWGYLAMTIVGVILIVLGFLVITRKGAHGWIEVVLGLGLIAFPIIRTAQERRATREREARERAARAEEEKRNRKILASYTAALDRLRANPNRERLLAVERERALLQLPYELWSEYARATVLRIAYATLDKLGSAQALEVSRTIERCSRAAGLEPADELGVKLDLYRTAVWHLLADDRVGPVQQQTLEQLSRGLGIGPNDVPLETQALAEFDRLRGYTTTNTPNTECRVPLRFHEECIHEADGSTLRTVRDRKAGPNAVRRVPHQECAVSVTTKRVVVSTKKTLEIELSKIDDVEVDADENVLRIRTARGMDDVFLQVVDPIYTAALIDIAASIDDRPRGFA